MPTHAPNRHKIQLTFKMQSNVCTVYNSLRLLKIMPIYDYFDAVCTSMYNFLLKQRKNGLLQRLIGNIVSLTYLIYRFLSYDWLKVRAQSNYKSKAKQILYAPGILFAMPGDITVCVALSFFTWWLRGNCNLHRFHFKAFLPRNLWNGTFNQIYDYNL